MNEQEVVESDIISPFLESIQARIKSFGLTRSLYEAAACQGPVSVAGGVFGFVRPLKQSEINALQSCNNQCQNWSKWRILVENEEMAHNDMSAWFEKHVTNNSFEGIVVITISQASQDPQSPIPPFSELQPGIHHNTFIANCIFEPLCRVYRNAILRNTHVGRTAVVMHNGLIDTNTTSHDAYQTISISVGAESGGGRKLSLVTESTMVDVCYSLGMSRCKIQPKSLSTIETTTQETCFWNTIGDSCILRNTPTVNCVYMAMHSKIEAATLVNHAVLLPKAEITHGATVNHVHLQWNASISHHSNVSNTLLMECASVGPMSTVVQSVLGPDVHVSSGEVHASILGPNTNAHHQSLLIGVLWPLGRGNVGYGANVGSNHTGRLPDQECLSGEGVFWGLSTVVKFPVTMAPYSLVAAGTTVSPQTVELPFSLLVDQNILPGWLLSHSPYTLSRNEIKIATRRKAKRHEFYTGWKILRPSMIDACLAARRALQSVTEIQDVYKTTRAVPGIGMMHLTEKARLGGIDAYTAIAQRYALSGLLERCLQGVETLDADLASCGSLEQHDLSSIAWPVLPWEEENVWNHQKKVLAHEFPQHGLLSLWIIDCLRNLVQLEQDYAERVHTSKQRDDDRGTQTIPSYMETHVQASVDEVVVDARVRARHVEQEVEKIVMQLTKRIPVSQSKL